MKYESLITCHSKDMANVKVFESGSNFKVKVTRSKMLVPIERYTLMKYESPITCHSKDMANVIVFAGRQMDRAKTICSPPFHAEA
jgi:hypothetical protein